MLICCGFLIHPAHRMHCKMAPQAFVHTAYASAYTYIKNKQLPGHSILFGVILLLNAR